MKLVYCVLADNGDGSQRIEWYKGSEFTREAIIEAAEADKYDSYASGDGVQITCLQFPDYFNLEDMLGICWETQLPGEYEDE